MEAFQAFGLGPLPNGWECKIEPKTGRLYYINHRQRETQWLDPRLASTCCPSYCLAITQPTAYFEDGGLSRWSSPVPSLKGFSLHRRGSSPRIAPSPTFPHKKLGHETTHVLFEPSSTSSSSNTGTVIKQFSQSSSTTTNTLNSTSNSNSKEDGRKTPQMAIYQFPESAQKVTLTSASGHETGTGENSNSNLSANIVQALERDERERERPPSARSYSTSSYTGLPSSFLATCDNETAFRTVSAIFPTAGEPHIRHLFHKYHNRANVVISALQVEKFPLASEFLDISPKNLGFKDGLTIDGDNTETNSINTDSKSIGIQPSPLRVGSYISDSPARTGTPVSLQKFSNKDSSAGSLFTARWGSPLLSASPQLQIVKEISKMPKCSKMKLKYLKGIYPAADEMLLYDILTSCENNVSQASEKMIRKGFSRTPPAKPARHKWLEVRNLIEKRQRALDLLNPKQDPPPPVESPFPTPIMKPVRPHLSVQEKANRRDFLIKSFPKLPERFVTWALEAAEFNREKAEKLLQGVDTDPRTPDEFKPFIQRKSLKNNGMEEEDQEEIDPGEKKGKEKKTKRKKEKEAFWKKEISPERVQLDKLLSENGYLETEKENEKGGNTPDSGFYESAKPRKLSFISNLFGKTFKGNGFSLAKGPSCGAKGPNPQLVSKNYAKRHGPDARLSKGPSNLAKGPQIKAQGPNSTLAKGSLWAAANNNNNPSFQVSVS